MARLTQSQLAGFRIGTDTDRAARPKRATKDPQPPTEQPALAFENETPSTQGPAGLLPAAPTRGEARVKIGLTLPLELAEQVRALTRQGYALADLVMVAYQDHRDELVAEHDKRTTRQLQRRTIGRSAFTITLSTAERDALDTLARRLDTSRSQTVAALVQSHLIATDKADAATGVVAPSHSTPGRGP